MAGPCGCALSTKRWMCRVLIRIQPLLIVCTHAGFDHGGKTFSSSCLESVLLRQNMITRSYSPSLSARLLSFSVFLSSSRSIVSCPRLHIPRISLIHLFILFFFYPPISFDHLLKKNVDFHPREVLPVCL